MPKEILKKFVKIGKLTMRSSAKVISKICQEHVRTKIFPLRIHHFYLRKWIFPPLVYTVFTYGWLKLQKCETALVEVDLHQSGHFIVVLGYVRLLGTNSPDGIRCLQLPLFVRCWESGIGQRPNRHNFIWATKYKKNDIWTYILELTD